MRDSEKTRNQLLEELAELRQRVATLQAADESRRHGEESARRLIEAAPLGIHECDTEGRITFVNPAQEAITGYSAEELLGTYVWDRIEQESQKEAASLLLKSLVAEQSVPSPFFAKNTRKNGEVFDVRIDWNYRRDSQGQISGFVSVISDVTEQNRMERELQRSEERYRMLTESTTDMIFILNRSGDVLYANRSAAAGIRYDAESLVGLRQDNLFSPEKVKRHRESVTGVFETGKVYETDGMYHFGPDEIWLNTRLMPLRDESENVTAVMASPATLLIASGREGSAETSPRRTGAAGRRANRRTDGGEQGSPAKLLRIADHLRPDQGRHHRR